MPDEIKAATEHELKCWPIFFEAVLKGDKPFELRKNDRNFHLGDTLWLREFEPGNEGYEGMDVVQPEYTGRELRVIVTYVLENKSFLQPGIVALGLSRPTPAPVEGQWRPIEEAPKDGTFVLIGHETKVCMGKWHDLEKCWLISNRWRFDPTHWMPLPSAPPKKGKG